MKERVFDAEFLKKLDSIVINVRMAMSEGTGGNRKSRSKGSSVEFSDFREYSMGDDFRRIDWNAYGRFDKHFVKQFMEEREAVVNIFIDCSRSMDFGSPKKYIYGLKLAGVLAFLALNNLDRVCLNGVSGSDLKQSTAVVGRTMYDRCIGFLEGLDFTGETSLNEAIKKKDIKGRGISIIISDFFSPGGIEEAVKYLMYKKQDVALVHILSKEEIQPELNGQVRLLDSETGKAVDIAVTPVLLKQYERALESFEAGLREFCARMGVAYVRLSSDESVEKAVLEDFTRSGIIR